MSVESEPERDEAHENPVDESDVNDRERAEMLSEYLQRFESEFGTRPKLMPLDESGKAPIIQGRCSLDSDKGQSYLVTANEAVRQVREEGVRGFAIYAGKKSHNTGQATFIDHDDSEAFPAPTGEPTLEVLSGSGRGSHETYRNDPDDPVSNARVGSDEGEVRANNWYVVAPGSIHPSGGVYHITEDRPIATISDSDLTDRMRPASANNDPDIEYTPKSESDESHAREVVKHYRNIQDYLTFGSNDRSDSDFHVCCRMIEHGVDEREAYNLLATNANTKVDAADAPDDYWQMTWDKAKNKVGTDANTETLTTGSGSQTSVGESDESQIPRPNGFDVRNGGYAKYHPPRDDEDEGYYEQITNFQIETNSRLTHSDTTREYHLTIHPADGESYDVTCEPVVFNDLRKFRREVLDGWTTTFDGKQQDLNRLKEFVGSQDAKHRTGTKQLGLHDDEWVTPDGSLTADGWADDPETVFTDVETPLATAFSLTPAQADYDDETVTEILRLLPQTRTTERFLPVLGWFYAAPVRPHIQDWSDEFNLLNVLGDTGSGKTTTLETLWQAFGVNQELPEAKATPFSIMRMIASSNALPVILDEYKPAEIRDYKLNNLHSNLRESTKGGTVTKGRADMGVDTYHLNAPVCISGEQPIQGPAEERRTILTVFKRDVTIGETDERKAHAQLVGGEIDGTWYDGYDLTDHALAYYQWLLDQDKDDLHSLWQNCRQTVLDILDREGHTNLDDLVIQGFQTIKFGCTLYRAFADSMGLTADETPVTTTAIEQSIQHVAKGGTGAEHTSHLDRLLGLFTRAAKDGYLVDGQHYTVVNKDDPNAELRVHLSSAFDKVRKYARDHDVRGDDLLSSAKDYKDRIKDAAANPESYIATHSQKTPPLNRCVGLHVSDAAELVDGFEPEAFGVEQKDESHSSRFDPISLHDVDSDPTGYPTVKGEIKTLDYPEGEDSPAVKATLVDNKTAIDVISWDDADCLDCDDEVVIENAKKSEFDGETQLVIKNGVTTVYKAPDDGQEQLGAGVDR